MNTTPKQPHTQMKNIISNLSHVIEGKEDKIELLVLALVAGGHILIEDIPGVGKTTLARALSKTIDGKFARIQFTPDLLPSDITGSTIYQQKTGEFNFKSGPIFANIVLADEINRASARTQSALLEAMSEEHVTVDATEYALPQPFIVMATQNPIEYHGTYPLPESQLDRFMLQIDLGYPPLHIEQSLAINRSSEDPINSIQTIITFEELSHLRTTVDKIKIEDSVSQYLMQIVNATRNHPQIRLGVSTRGTLLYARIARALAILEKRDYVIPEDIKRLAIPVINHRILLNTNAEYKGVATKSIIEEILNQEKVPR